MPRYAVVVIETAGAAPGGLRRHLGAMILFGLLVRVLGLLVGEVSLPVGGDAPFWGVRALELRGGEWLGSHPPAYPALGALVALVTGLGIDRSLWILAWFAGVAVPPAMALAVRPLGGDRAALLAGWLTASLPALYFTSLRVEPTSLVALAVAVAAALAVRAAANGAPGWALGAGAVAGFAAMTKENGLVAAVLLLAGVAVATRRRRFPVVAAFVAGLGPPVGVKMALDAAFAARSGIEVSKLELPLHDVQALLVAGTIPHALTEGRAELPVASLARIAQPGTSPGERAVRFLGIQVHRLATALGPWVLALPAGMVAAARRGPASWTLVALGLALVPCVVVVIQPRHADVAALGGVACVALALAPRPRWSVVVLLLAFAHAGWRTWSYEWDELRRTTACAESEALVAGALRDQLPDDGPWCSTAAWFPFRLGVTAQRCLLEDVRVGEQRTFVVERNDLLALRDRGTAMSLDLRCGAPASAGCIGKTSICAVTNAGLGPSRLRWSW